MGAAYNFDPHQFEALNVHTLHRKAIISTCVYIHAKTSFRVAKVNTHNLKVNRTGKLH